METIVVEKQQVVTVTPLSGAALDVTVQGHHLVADQPVAAGGEGAGPEPLAIFVGALAACVATFAVGHLRSRGLATDGLSVTAAYDVGGSPRRITSLTIRITPPRDLPHERMAPLLATARHCTAHNTLMQPPVVDIDWA
jgi:putative redox protein